MRTTITLEDDVAITLKRLRAEQQKTFKQVVNEVLRRGLIATTSGSKKETRYSTPVLTAGPCKYADLDNVAEVLAVAEAEDYS